MPKGSKITEGTEETAAAVPEEPTETVEKPAETVQESTETAEEPTEAAEGTEEADNSEPAPAKRRGKGSRVVAYGLLPALALLLALAAGYLKWQDDALRNSDLNNAESPARESMQAARDSTVAMLSYKPDTVEQQLNAARDSLTGEFRDSYTSLINDVVIPGAKQKQISAVASVPAAASVSAEPEKAVVLVFVNQTVVVGQDAPTDTASSVRVTMVKDGDRWLIEKFDPV
jgi:Mce-associated membrane protein